jgi:hypothetical protein
MSSNSSNTSFVLYLAKYFREGDLQIHFCQNITYMVDNFSHHQTWPPPLLKIEHLTKKYKNYFLSTPFKT